MKTVTATEARDALETVGRGDEFVVCELAVESREAVSGADLGQALAGSSGVLIYTDRVEELSASEDPPETGRLLSADLVADDAARGAQIRWDGGAYRLTTYEERPGDRHLRYVEEHISVLDGKRVRFAVYLQPSDEGSNPAVGVWRPFAARFLGLAEAGEE